MSLLADVKIYLDITDNDQDAKLNALLAAGYSSMTNTADVTGAGAYSDDLTLDPLVRICLFTYVAKELETDPDRYKKLDEIYTRQVNTLAYSSAFGDYTAISPEV